MSEARPPYDPPVQLFPYSWLRGTGLVLSEREQGLLDALGLAHRRLRASEAVRATLRVQCDELERRVQGLHRAGIEVGVRLRPEVDGLQISVAVADAAVEDSKGAVIDYAIQDARQKLRKAYKL